MSKADASEQVKFLVACIGATTNGRPDFAAVATELGIVSKAAAQKRYERMLKAHGASASPAKKDGTNDGTPPPATPKKRGAAAANGSAKKRATPKGAKTLKQESDDEEEQKPKATRGSKIKSEVKVQNDESEDDEDIKGGSVSSGLSDPPENAN